MLVSQMVSNFFIILHIALYIDLLMLFFALNFTQLFRYFVLILFLAKPQRYGIACCYALTASCLACAAGQSVKDYCIHHPDVVGCSTGTQLCFI